ncbi:MAG: hypothetical protein JK586_00160 [Nocardiopsis sp. BM-2018]|uniref:Uncharacterized protein n=1 Tax=Nocardiopsis metallicus TaxID=179819 RepID=A0A840WJD7_9ACTN|nr:hypothetical protein [Nocardiopsis metallicus]MBB5491686.1 hypothetical protein [Nocardiopsis metallicus]QRN80150.1 MAG: hypothetical protein JK586_00160 [Nocardiopsis sp. BM-2018]
MPVGAKAVRVLMFIGGPVGILLGLFSGLLAMASFGFAPDGGAEGFGGRSLILTVIPLIYGVASIALASMMGRRTKKVHEGVVYFNIAAIALLVILALVTLLTGAPFDGLIPLIFHGVMLGLMYSASVKAFYGV